MKFTLMNSFVFTIQVDKDEVQYDKTSKQVDVHALKEALWDCVHEITEVSGTVSILPFYWSKFVSETFFSYVYPSLLSLMTNGGNFG